MNDDCDLCYCSASLAIICILIHFFSVEINLKNQLDLLLNSKNINRKSVAEPKALIKSNVTVKYISYN